MEAGAGPVVGMSGSSQAEEPCDYRIVTAGGVVSLTDRHGRMCGTDRHSRASTGGSRTDRHERGQAECDVPLVTTSDVSVVFDLGMVERGPPSKMAARRRCAEIASAPCGSRSAE